jgi:hypothetical protein
VAGLGELMKKFILSMILLFCLTGIVRADEYADSLGEISNRVRMNLNIATNSAGAPDSVIYGYVREGAMAITMSSLGDLLIDTVVTSSNNFIFATDTNLAAIKDVIFMSVDSIRPLIWTPRASWGSLYSEAPFLITGRLSGFEGHCEYYDWEAGFLYLYPVPKTVDTMIITGFAKPNSMISDTTFVTQMAVLHRPGIIYYATSMLATRMQRLPEASAWEARYDKYIATINARVNVRADVQR